MNIEHIILTNRMFFCFWCFLAGKLRHKPGAKKLIHLEEQTKYILKLKSISKYNREDVGGFYLKFEFQCQKFT
jgi:hypothetical protein